MPLLPRLLSALLLAGIGLQAKTPAPARAAAPARPLAGHEVQLEITRTGIYRLSGADLRAHGIDWSGVNGADLAIVTGGKPVPRLVSTTGALGPSSYVEFAARFTRTFYADRSIYLLRVAHDDALPVPQRHATPGAGPAPRTYVGQYAEAKRTLIDQLSPNPQDQWFYDTLTSVGPPATKVQAAFDLPALRRTGRATLTYDTVGVTDFGGPFPQHHMLVVLNGKQIDEFKSTGTAEKVTSVHFSATVLTRHNVVQFIAPGDVKNKDNIDTIEIRTFAVAYPHTFAAQHGSLNAHLGAHFRVDVSHLTGPSVAVWRTAGSAAERLTGISVTRDAHGYRVSFATPGPGQYLIASDSALLKPAALRLAPSTATLLNGSARMVVIGPPALTRPLSPLLAYHRSHGMSVKVVNVAAIYAQYSGGLRDAASIKTYIADAQRDLGTEYVLLVGADTFDYYHYTQCMHVHKGKLRNDCTGNPTNTSFVPSLYVSNVDFGQIPSDWAYVANLPVAIGRIPAVNAAQVRIAVTKSLAYARGGASPHAVFVAGSDQPDFAATSDALVNLLPAPYQVTRAYLKELGRKVVHETLLDAINAGASVVDYVGHGNLEQWGKPPAPFTVDDVPKLTNGSKVGAFFGWGCQTSYDVDPTDQALNARLLFAAKGGAALTLGSTGLDEAEPQAVMAKVFFQKLFVDPSISTVGQALQQTKLQVLKDAPFTQPPVESYELFGDPALPASVLRGTS